MNGKDIDEKAGRVEHKSRSHQALADEAGY